MKKFVTLIFICISIHLSYSHDLPLECEEDNTFELLSKELGVDNIFLGSNTLVEIDESIKNLEQQKVLSDFSNTMSNLFRKSEKERRKFYSKTSIFNEESQELFSNWIKKFNPSSAHGNAISPDQLFFEFAEQFKESWCNTCFPQQELYYSNRAADCLLRAVILENKQAKKILKTSNIKIQICLRYFHFPEQAVNNPNYLYLIQFIKKKWVDNTAKRFLAYDREDSLVQIPHTIENILEKDKEDREDYYLESNIFKSENQIFLKNMIHTVVSKPWTIKKAASAPSNDELLFEWANELKFYYYNYCYHNRFDKSHYLIFSTICLIISAASENSQALSHFKTAGIASVELNKYSLSLSFDSINDWSFIKRVEKAWVQTPLQYK